MYYALILLYQEWRNKDAQSFILIMEVLPDNEDSVTFPHGVVSQ